ncbi:MAG: hypothetical protein ACRDON_06145 [Gaiellaceae bacterium]
MRPDPWQRWAPLSGIAYVVLLLVAFGIAGDGAGDEPGDVRAYYADAANRDREILVFFLLVAAALAFVWFLGMLRGALVRAEGEPARWTALGFGAGTASATLLLASASLFVAPGAAATQEEFPLDPATANMFSNAGYALLVGSVMVAALLVVAASIVALRTALLPRWSALSGFLVAAAQLFAIFFFPIFVWLGWVLAVSAILILRSARVADWRRGTSTAAD